MTGTTATADRHAVLIDRVASGDKAAMAALYHALERPLFAFVQSRLNDPFLSNDILQDVFLDVWRGADRFEARSSVRSWIFGMAWRKVIDVHRASKRLSFSDSLPDQEDESPAALSLIGQEQESRRLRGCMADLKDDHRTAIELAFYHDLGYREISEVMGVPEGTVKTRVFHAKKLLQHCLERSGIKGSVP
ncbi:RNA polymerase sigma factor [Tabrizicola oligotrophica]|uniref:Sigma-70 family RNA polymerase sigma factor n=1 Tax=Tabrizicola oligotrophica TaxID=2710650 RepID=A0A6M0QST7_9RHOB|nr:sigma-70 family RNA polymerase sigma factor [Tabrizicola oligotrophica]NEY90071.1 sigma-70 family RNA polymerase sigma factor [Tabrizicola oligotrophica]